MSGVWGRNIKLTIFGESHGMGVGIILDGLAPGLKIDEDEIHKQMLRRAPGRNSWSTARKEADRAVIQSGFYKGYTTGAPLCAFIKNNDQQSRAYDDLLGKIRPGHSDYTGHKRFDGFNDPRGGGHFSGRLTAALTFAGAIAAQYLSKLNIICGAWIASIGNVEDPVGYPESLSAELLNIIKTYDFPAKDQSLVKLMQDEVDKARAKADSVGGTVGLCAINVPAGLGDPFFYSIESVLTGLLFSVPAVKAVEFGDGFNLSTMNGSSSNDPWRVVGSEIISTTNRNGGINGGITNGMPIFARVGVKPTPSIASAQKTVDFMKKENTEISIFGRHDPCIVPRAVCVIESAMAITLLDFITGYYGKRSISDWKRDD